MALTIKEVEHVALLARLSLSDEEKALFSRQLSSMNSIPMMWNLLPTYFRFLMFSGKM